MLFLNKNKFLAVIFWLFSAVIMVLIFNFSAATGDESEELSQNLLTKIIEFIGNFISHNTLRKLAHFSEFAALGFCVTGAIHYTFGKRKFYIPLIPCVLYAISDEIHQHFVPERACRLFDMFVDSCGIMTGICIFLLFIHIISKIIKKKEL